MVQFCNQLDAMQSMKEQLEQRTKMIEANIQRQQDELRQIQEELQRVQGHSLQVEQPDRPPRLGCFYAASFSPCSPASLHLLDVPAERSQWSQPELHSDGPRQHSAAGGDVQHAGPAGVPGAPAGHHTAAARRPASVPAADTPPGPELGSHAGLSSSCVSSPTPIPSRRH